MNVEYSEILSAHISAIWKLLSLPIVISLVISIVFFAKNAKGFKKFTNCIIFVLGIIVIGLVNTIPAFMDLRNNSTETITFKTAYYYNQSYLNDEAWLGLRPILIIKSDGTQIECQDSNLDFPYEIKDGKITYAKHSKIILDYSGTVIHEDSF